LKQENVLNISTVKHYVYKLSQKTQGGDVFEGVESVSITLLWI